MCVKQTDSFDLNRVTQTVNVRIEEALYIRRYQPLLVQHH